MPLRGLVWVSLMLVACGGRYRAGDDAEGSVAGRGGAGGSNSGVATAGSAQAGSAQAGSASEPAHCAEQRQSYLDYREQVIADQVAAAEPCQSTEQCGLFFDTTGCGITCGVPIPNAARRGIDDRLYAFTEASCDAECHVGPSICMERPAAVCVAGKCQ